MRKRSLGPSRVTAAALGGFLAGAITAVIAVWVLTDVIRSPTASGQHLDEELLTADRRDLSAIASSITLPVIEADPISELRDRELELPVHGMVRRELRDSFHEARGSNYHEAIDVIAPRNTPVLAVEDGTIAKLFESKAGGTTVYQFDPTKRYVYYYAHLERYADRLEEGDDVERGEVLGYVGTSGNAPKDTPHLHFAIFRLTDKKRWWEGAPINPYEVLK